MKLSITCPTRSRLKSLERFINSAFDMAKDPDNIELIFSYDSDDNETKEFFNNPKYQINNIVVREVPITDEIIKNGINIHDLYFNPSARMAKGKYIWGTGNDVEFITPYYDHIIEEEIENFLSDKPDRLAYVYINHDILISPVQWCAFPITTKESVETIGGTMPNEIHSWGADKAMWDIYMSLCEPRILNLVEKIAVKHWSYHTGRKYGEEEFEKTGNRGSVGDSITYRLSTSVLHLTREQYIYYINKLNNRIMQCKI